MTVPDKATLLEKRQSLYGDLKDDSSVSDKPRAIEFEVQTDETSAGEYNCLIVQT